mmetsp:Transcript_14132/g.59019  ORF Transcript_14132/g.59019 Transcript_14132/m.59019 type:complete len:202 (-) Transcript_14132:305-910(-)
MEEVHARGHVEASAFVRHRRGVSLSNPRARDAERLARLGSVVGAHLEAVELCSGEGCAQVLQESAGAASDVKELRGACGAHGCGRAQSVARGSGSSNTSLRVGCAREEHLHLVVVQFGALVRQPPVALPMVVLCVVLGKGALATRRACIRLRADTLLGLAPRGGLSPALYLGQVLEVLPVRPRHRKHVRQQVRRQSIAAAL